MCQTRRVAKVERESLISPLASLEDVASNTNDARLIAQVATISQLSFDQDEERIESRAILTLKELSRC